MKAMEERSEKLTRFVSQLLQIPALRQLPALRKEEQALQFLRQSASQLQPVFASLGTDPAAVARAIKSATDELLESELATLSSSRIALSCFPVMAGGRQPPPKARSELGALLAKVAAHPVSRHSLAGALTAIYAELAEKYIAVMWERRKYTYMEVSRVQRLSIGADEMADLLRLVLLIRPASYQYMTVEAESAREGGDAPLQVQYVQKVFSNLCGLLPSFPTNIIALSLRSTLAFPATADLEAVSRLCAIFSMAGRSMALATKVVDRGADSPQKSWFNVARRNARWHGLDPRMLDELYTIAAENNW